MNEQERAHRIGLNEAVFREINERLEALTDSSQLHDDILDLVCECGRADCSTRIQLTRAAYEHVRSDPLFFAVTPGHEQPDVEDVVEHHAVYDVVRKQAGEAERVAELTDPRGT